MKKTMKIAALLLCAVMMTCLMVGCDETTRMKEENYTENTKTQILDMYGLPEVSNFFEYSQLKEIYELRDNPNLICYWYTKNDMSGKWVYQGTCVGSPMGRASQTLSSVYIAVLRCLLRNRTGCTQTAFPLPRPGF